MEQLSRRRFITSSAALAAGAAGLAGCGGSDSISGTAATTESGTANGRQLIANFPQEGFVGVGEATRLPFLITGADGAPLDVLSGPVTFRVSLDGRSVGAPIDVMPHAEGIPKAFLPLRTTFAEVGYHDIAATYEGAELEPVTVNVQEDLVIPRVGTKLSPVATPTTSDPAGVSPICTRSPFCPFHDVSVDTSLVEQRPLLVLLSTPQFCSSAICGPVLELLITASGQHPDVRVIHVEPYADPNDVPSISLAKLSPFVSATKFPYEPTLLVVSADGTILDRLDTVFDAKELDAAFSSVA